MIEEARLEEVGSGLAPVSAGWFVVNVSEAAWVRNDAFGGRCVFESSHACSPTDPASNLNRSPTGQWTKSHARQRPLLLLDQQQALSRQYEEVFLARLGVVHARRL